MYVKHARLNVHNLHIYCAEHLYYSPLEKCHFQHFLGFLSESPCKFLVSSKMR